MSRKRKAKEIQWDIPKTKNETEKKFKGSDLLPYRWFNIYICAKRRSGKTVTIYNLLKKFAKSNTVVLFFVSTIYNDENYDAMRKFLDQKQIPYEEHTSIRDEAGQNQVRAFIRVLQEEKAAEQATKAMQRNAKKMRPENILHYTDLGAQSVWFERPREKFVELPDEKERPQVWKSERDLLNTAYERTEREDAAMPKKVPKKPKEDPEYIIIFDDLGDELRDRAVVELMKRSRHFRCKVIVSSQNLFDLPSQGINQLSYAIIFKNMPLDKVEKMREKLTLDIPPDKMTKLYLEHTKKPFDFILLDILKDQIRYKFGPVIYDAESQRDGLDSGGCENT